MKYGYRVFDVVLREGSRGRTMLDWAQPADGLNHYAEVLEQFLRQLKSRPGALICIPNLDRPGEDPTSSRVGDPMMRVLSVTRRSPHHISFSVRYGVKGEFEAGMDDAGSEVALDERAASSTFRVELYAPASGRSARMVVETIGSACPVTMVGRWLGRASYEIGSHFIRLGITQLSDPDRIRSLITESEHVEIRLTRQGIQADGQRKTKPTVFRQEVINEERKGNLLEQAVGWLDGDRDAEYSVVRIEEIAGLDTDKLDEAGLRFDDAAIIITDEEGKEKTLHPDRIRTMFTYVLNHEVRPQDETWAREVAGRVRGLSVGTDIVVD